MCVSLEEWFPSFRTIQRLHLQDQTVHWLVHQYKVWLSVYLLSPNYISRYIFVSFSCIHFYPNRSKNVDQKDNIICKPPSKMWLLLADFHEIRNYSKVLRGDFLHWVVTRSVTKYAGKNSFKSSRKSVTAIELDVSWITFGKNRTPIRISWKSDKWFSPNT